ncbi:MAG: hypothetical protein U9O53_01285, partial [archaeon]|nr:hypothetical protein [archaeon]
MKIIQTELPITLEQNNKEEGFLYRWAISSEWDEKPEIRSELGKLDRVLCIPAIKKPLIGRTELDTPFCG